MHNILASMTPVPQHPLSDISKPKQFTKWKIELDIIKYTNQPEE